MGFFSPEIGIDLGTNNVLFYVANKGIVLREPSLVIVSGGEKRVVQAVGEEARQLLGRMPQGFRAVWPIHEGVIADFDLAASMLRYFIRRALGVNYVGKPRTVLTIPAGVTSMERRAHEEALMRAGGKLSYIVDGATASALGCGLPVFEPNGCMVVDIGGGTTDVAVVSLGGVVISHSIRVGGVKMDEAIINYIKREFNIMIGDRTAEEVKLDLGSALPLHGERRARIRGRDMVTNLPQTTEITSTQIYEAIQEPCQAILRAIKWVLERTPPELAADVMHHGIYLTGGGSLLYGMDQMIASELGIPVLLSKEPTDCAALGLGNIIENYDLLQHLGRNSFLHEF